ncbi:uncharacterized protein LOC143712355 [Siphateles boraxobius]|uniref:uncharacterized protein LOC143712355 n=1 Tax=Siphateles boraxobius TaxID=180520 RepID=UPI004063D08C
MQIWMWLILSGVFTVTLSYCSGLSLQQKNRTTLLARETGVADQGQFENGTKVQGVHKKILGFGTPLDPLSRSFMKTKKDKNRQSKTPQKWPRQKGSVEQMMSGESSTFTVIRPGDTGSIDKAQLGESSPVQPPRTKPNGPMDVSTSDRNPTDHARIRGSNKRGHSIGFGLPIDRIGLGRLPHGRG